MSVNRGRSISRIFTSTFTLKVKHSRKDAWRSIDSVLAISAVEALKGFRSRRVKGLDSLERSFYRWKVVAGK